MKAAPDLIKTAGVSCTVTDARLIGNDKKTATDYYEVACQQGLGFAVLAKKDAAPQTYSCLETAAAGADGKPSALALHPARQRRPQGRPGAVPGQGQHRPATSRTPAPSAPAPRTPISKSPVRAAPATSSRPPAR